MGLCTCRKCIPAEPGWLKEAIGLLDLFLRMPRNATDKDFTPKVLEFMRKMRKEGICGNT